MVLNFIAIWVWLGREFAIVTKVGLPQTTWIGNIFI
jgi:hypothetical protein